MVLQPCGVLCSVKNRVENLFASAVLDYADKFLREGGVNYHIIPANNDVLGLCIHLDKNEDSYAFFSRFFGKFDALVKVN